MKKTCLLLLMSLAIISCKNEDEMPVNTVGQVNLKFNNKVGSSTLEMNNSSYTNQSNETYTVSELKYIISNIVLIDADGNEFVYPQADSYFVINEADANSKNIILNTIDSGSYSKIRFGFGVDQSNYPLNGINNFVPTAEETEMLWSWSAGYKFLKFEGTFNSTINTDKPFNLHVGSHGTTLDNYKEITLSLANPIMVTEDVTASANITMDVAKIFDSVNTFSLDEKSEVQVDPVYAPILAENVSTSFSVEQ